MPDFDVPYVIHAFNARGGNGRRDVSTEDYPGNQRSPMERTRLALGHIARGLGSFTLPFAALHKPRSAYVSSRAAGGQSPDGLAALHRLIECRRYRANERPNELVLTEHQMYPVGTAMALRSRLSTAGNAHLVGAERLTSTAVTRIAMCLGTQTNRLRDRALVQAFTRTQLDDLPGGVCRHEGTAGETDETKSCGEGKDTASEGAKKQGGTGVGGWSVAPKGCRWCSSDSEWVLLRTVTLDKVGGISGLDTTYWRRVKPVEVLCGVGDLMKRIIDLEASIELLQPKNEESVKPSERVLSDGVVTPNVDS